MKKVTMLCAAGTSTHIFAVKVQEALDEQNAPVRVNAWSVAQAKEQGVDSELILLTPQVQFEAELVRALFPDKRVEVILQRLRRHGRRRGGCPDQGGSGPVMCLGWKGRRL